MESKKIVLAFVLFMLVFSQSLMAQENGKIDFSMSVGFIYNLADNISEWPLETGSAFGVEIREFGINLNLMFFNNSNFGYYVGFFALGYNPSILGDEYFGIIPGIGYKKVINNNLSFIAGIGPEFRIGVIATDIHETKAQIGIGLGGTLEARLQVFRNFSFAGGVRISSNFFEKMNGNKFVLPYMGFGWN